MPFEQREHARQTRARAVLALGEQRRAGRVVAQRAGLVIQVKRQADRDACPVRPRLRCQITAGPDALDHLADLSLSERPRRRRGLLLLRGRRERCDENNCGGERDTAFHGNLRSETVGEKYHEGARCPLPLSPVVEVVAVSVRVRTTESKLPRAYGHVLR